MPSYLTATKQLQAVNMDDKPGLAAGVQQITEVNVLLTQCRRERRRQSFEISDLKKQIRGFKRELKKYDSG